MVLPLPYLRLDTYPCDYRMYIDALFSNPNWRFASRGHEYNALCTLSTIS